uniref:Tudor domain-containing protein n=1 Tax=Panagrolaimus superbus TaxID=310955 RepID=A0A914YIZ7_9BILA
MDEKRKIERISSKQDASNASAPSAPTWSSIAAPKKDTDNFKPVAATCESKPSENRESEAARQQEVANLNAVRKNTDIAGEKLPQIAKKDNTVSEKDDVSKNEEDEGNPKQEKYEGKNDKHQGTPKHDRYERSNNGNNSGPRNNFRKGRNRNNNEDTRNYTSRPSGNATLFDHIRTQMVNPPPESPIRQHDNTQGNRRNNGSRYDNREGYNNAHQSSSSTVASDEFAQMKVSDVPQDPPHGGNNYRNGGTRGRGGRGKPFYANYSNPYQQHAPYPQQQFPPIFAAPPHPSMLPPPAGYVPPMPQHIRNPNVTGIEIGKQVLAPFTDNNYYLGVVLLVDEVNGMSLVQYTHCPLPHFIHTEYLQLCHVQAQA